VAITSRVGPHDSWLQIAGQSYQCIEGEVVLDGVGGVGTINGRLPLNAPGYMESLAGISELQDECIAVVKTADGTATLAKGTVWKIEFDLTGGIIHVQARQAMAFLHLYKDFGSYKNQTLGQVFQQAAQKAGIQVAIEGSAVMAGVKVKDDYVRMHDGQSAAAVGHQMAKAEGAKIWTDKDNVVHYKAGFGDGEMDGGGGSYTLFWKKPAPGSPMVSDCLSLIVIHNLEADSADSGSAKGWGPYEKKNATSGDTSTSSGSGKAEPKLDVPSKDQQQAKAHADAAYAHISSHAWEVRATFVGDPSVEPNGNLVLTGTGVFDMTYPIDKVTHRFGINGYTTTVNSKGKGKNGG
jgi:hypothetical protein